MKTQIIVSGANGRMGQTILRLAAEDEDIELIGGLEAPGKAGTHEVLIGNTTVRMADAVSRLKPPPGAVLIEFTEPGATVEHCAEAAEAGVKMVIGTTGLSQGDHACIQQASARTAIVIGPNMSVGVNVLLDLVQRLAGVLTNYDIEIVEMHHRSKRDAPSGTAVALGNSAAAGRNVTLGQLIKHGRHGLVGERSHGEIGMHALRGGDVVGEHTVIFAGPGERIEVVHKAHNRDTFAAGAIKAAKFLTNKPKGLFTMQDVLFG